MDVFKMYKIISCLLRQYEELCSSFAENPNCKFSFFLPQLLFVSHCVVASHTISFCFYYLQPAAIICAKSGQYWNWWTTSSYQTDGVFISSVSFVNEAFCQFGPMWFFAEWVRNWNIEFISLFFNRLILVSLSFFF